MERGEEIEAKKYEGVMDGGNTPEGQAGGNHTRIILTGIPEWMKERSEFDSSQKDKTTERLSPDAPVKDIGNVFRRILHFIESLAEV